MKRLIAKQFKQLTKGTSLSMTNREYGMAALNLQMTDKVCRMEYSVLGHEELLKRVTGRETVNEDTMRDFMNRWDICMTWNTMVFSDYLGPYVTKMGHASYAAGSTDFNRDVRCCFEDEDEVFSFDPYAKLPHYDEAELIRQFNENCDEQNAFSPDTVNTTGTYITAMSGLIEMLGWELLLTCAGIDSERFGEFLDRYTLWMEQFFRALAKSKAPVVMIHDDIVWTEGAFINPGWYRKHIFPAYERYLSYLHDAGKKIIFTSDGNYTEFIDDIAACGIDSFVLEPTTDMAYIAKKYGKTHGFVGNADTRVLLLGGKEDIRREVQRCMNIGRDCPGFIMAVGNHIPANTPVDSCLWYDEFCKEYGRR